MYSEEQKNEIYKIMGIYKEIHHIVSISQTLSMENDTYFLNFKAANFLDFIKEKGYITSIQASKIYDMLDGYSDKEEAFMDYLEFIKKPKAIFDIWYINYIAETCKMPFEEYFNGWKTEILSSSFIIKNEAQLEDKLSISTKDFKDVEKYAFDAYLVQLDLSSYNLLKENLEALKELSTDDLETKIIDDIEKYLKDLE